MYVALAVRFDTRLLTADDRLEAALRNMPAVADHIQLVRTFEPGVQEGDEHARPSSRPPPAHTDKQGGFEMGHRRNK